MIRPGVDEPEDQGLFDYMDFYDDDDAPDGAWWAMLEDSVGIYNIANKTQYDPFESVHVWIEWHNKQPDND